MGPEFWVVLLSGNNLMVAAILAQAAVIIIMGRYISKLVDKIIDLSTKSSEILEKLSNDYRMKKD